MISSIIGIIAIVLLGAATLVLGIKALYILIPLWCILTIIMYFLKKDTVFSKSILEMLNVVEKDLEYSHHRLMDRFKCKTHHSFGDNVDDIDLSIDDYMQMRYDIIDMYSCYVTSSAYGLSILKTNAVFSFKMLFSRLFLLAKIKFLLFDGNNNKKYNASKMFIDNYKHFKNDVYNIFIEAIPCIDDSGTVTYRYSENIKTFLEIHDMTDMYEYVLSLNRSLVKKNGLNVVKIEDDEGFNNSIIKSIEFNSKK